MSVTRDVLVIGATGATGIHAYRECVAQGLVVEAMVRDLGKGQSMLGADAKCVEGDMTKPESLDDAFSGVKRIIMAIGKRRGETGSSSEAIDYLGVKNVAEVARRHGIQKIVHVTSNGVDSPDRWFISFLNFMSGMGLGWKLRGENALRASGVPYVVVRPVGLKNKDGDVPPIIKQCIPYEWGICMISREVVGKILVHALMEKKCANCTVNCREDPAQAKQNKGLKDFDWSAALCDFGADSPIPASFEDHAEALERRKSQGKQLVLASVVALGLLALCSRI
jgi:uncharacterized protein YbjT (DUF2867 family)